MKTDIFAITRPLCAAWTKCAFAAAFAILLAACATPAISPAVFSLAARFVCPNCRNVRHQLATALQRGQFPTPDHPFSELSEVAPSPVCCANHLSPFPGERKPPAEMKGSLPLPRRSGERCRAKRGGVGVDFSRRLPAC